MDIQELLIRESRTTIETWCRRNAQAVYVGNDTVLCRVLGKYVMSVPSTDRSVAARLMLDGYWEMWVTMAMARYVKPGMRCVDVGAHVGYYTLLMADWVGSTGSVIAYEPHVSSYRHLCVNAKMNGFDRVLANCAAVSDQNGVTRMHIDNVCTGNNTLNPKQDEYYESTVPVTCNVLDQIDGVVDFIKIDAERHEGRIWLGMQRLLERSPNVQIVLEYTTGHDDGELPRQIVESGFGLHAIQGDGSLQQLTVEQAIDPSETFRMLWVKR